MLNYNFFPLQDSILPAYPVFCQWTLTRTTRAGFLLEVRTRMRLSSTRMMNRWTFWLGNVWPTQSIACVSSGQNWLNLMFLALPTNI